MADLKSGKEAPISGICEGGMEGYDGPSPEVRGAPRSRTHAEPAAIDCRDASWTRA